MTDDVLPDDSWVFDSLVNFLHGNIWKIPVLGFIEEKSVVFDPDSYNNMTDDREDEFRKIHEEYKALVDFMLASFMEDIQVSPEQVEAACQSRESEKSHADSVITKVALEQLQAAEDFIAFRRLMTRKNIDLQLQSLELLVSKYGVLSPALRNQDAPESSGDNGEEDFLQVVIRYSDANDVFYTASNNSATNALTTTTHNAYLTSTIHKAFTQKPSPQKDPSKNQQHSVDDCSLKKNGEFQEEHENLSKPTCSVVSQTAQSLANPILQLEMSKPSTVLADKTEAVEINTSQLIHQEMAELGSDVAEAEPPVQAEVREGRGTKPAKKSVKFDETTVAEIATNAPEQHRILTSVRRALDQTADNEPAESLDLQYGGTEEEIRRRREYLSAQRDKLVALKKKERERQFAIHGGESQSQRPKSARAAQMALQSTPTPSSPDPTGKSLAARRALAERLKHELVEK